MNSIYYIFIAVLLYSAYRLYFRLAKKYNIVDIPNHRTMHEGATIRGGGIVIFIAMSIYSLIAPTPGYYFLFGLVIIGVTGFLDDILNLSGRLRFPLQVTAIMLMAAELHLFGLGIFLLLLVIIVSTGTLNAYNFMDGINGITGGYSLILIISLIYINNFTFLFIDNNFLIFFLLTIFIFNYFNFRSKAVCFAGDVGSLTIAYIVIYLVIKLCLDSGQLIYILLLTLYGIDTIFTIIQRIIRRENIFDAHRLHLFQVAVSKTNMPHLLMSMIYMLVQLMINIIIIALSYKSGEEQLFYVGILLLSIAVSYILIKKKMMTDLS